MRFEEFDRANALTWNAHLIGDRTNDVTNTHVVTLSDRKKYTLFARGTRAAARAAAANHLQPATWRGCRSHGRCIGNFRAQCDCITTRAFVQTQCRRRDF